MYFMQSKRFICNLNEDNQLKLDSDILTYGIDTKSSLYHDFVGFMFVFDTCERRTNTINSFLINVFL